MWHQLLQIGIATFAGACALMVVRTVAEVLPELVGLSRASGAGEPVTVTVTGRPGSHRRSA